MGPPTRKRESLPERSLKAVWHPCTQMKQHEKLPLVSIARAEGVWLYDYDGKRCMDLRQSWWEQGQKEGWTFLFYHDLKNPVFSFTVK